MEKIRIDDAVFTQLRDFINTKHDKLLCTADAVSEPDAALMGSPRLEEDGTLFFTISEKASVSLRNIQINPRILLVAFNPGPRARDYIGVRISALVQVLLLEGAALEDIRQQIAGRHGSEKASTLQAAVRCAITAIRPIVDRGQSWSNDFSRSTFP